MRGKANRGEEKSLHIDACVCVHVCVFRFDKRMCKLCDTVEIGAMNLNKLSNTLQFSMYL